MAAFAPTPEQEEAVRLYLTGENLAIEAGAGTGKTSTLLLLAQADPARRIQYVAFNRKIVDEGAKKFPANVDCNTMHSLAHRAIVKGNPAIQKRLDAGRRIKSTEIARILRLEPLGLTRQDGEYKKLSAPRLAGLTMKMVEGFCQSADTEINVRHMPYVNGIDVPPGEYANNNQVAAYLLPFAVAAWADLQQPVGNLPFRHEHYLKLWHLRGPVIPKDVILFDECQDASPILLAVVEAQTAAQRVYVGDSQQAIYGFTGAVNALERIKETGANVTYLTKSFRFGPAVAAVANRILNALDAPLQITGYEALASRVGPVPAPNVVLCRTNAKAVTTVLNAIRAGRRPYLVGGGGEILKFAKGAQRLIETGWTDHPELGCFSSWAEVQEYVEQDEQGGDLRLNVKLIDDFGIQVIVDALDGMIAERNADLIVSTAHKSKGLEWNSVKLASDFPDEPAGEELRLLYVACTRAKLALDITAVDYLRAVTETREEAAEDAPSPAPAGLVAGLAAVAETAPDPLQARADEIAAADRAEDANLDATRHAVTVPLADAVAETIDEVLASLTARNGSRVIVATPERIRNEIVAALAARGLVAEAVA